MKTGGDTRGRPGPGAGGGDDRRLAAAEALLGYAFRDRSLLLAALTHQSYAHGRAGVPDNQRLEFLGDAVLGLLAAEHLYRKAPGRDEGFLTMERSRAVSGEALAAVVRDAGLGPLMRFSPGVKDAAERSGARTLAALCEALFGAVWLDGGAAAAQALFEKSVAPRIDASLREGVVHVDPRGELQALALKSGWGEPVYETTRVEGDGHNFTYHVSVAAGGFSAAAAGANTRKACAAAAAALLAELRKQ